MKTTPFNVGDRVKYVGNSRIQTQEGRMERVYGSTGTVDKVIKSRKVARVLLDNNDRPRWCHSFDADWSNLAMIP